MSRSCFKTRTLAGKSNYLSAGLALQTHELLPNSECLSSPLLMAHWGWCALACSVGSTHCLEHARGEAQRGCRARQPVGPPAPILLCTAPAASSLLQNSGHICRARRRPPRAAERAQLPCLASARGIIPGRGRHQLKCLRGMFTLCSINTSLGSSVPRRHVLSHFVEIIPSLCSSRSPPRLLQVRLSHIRPRSAPRCLSFASAAWEHGRSSLGAGFGCCR